MRTLFGVFINGMQCESLMSDYRRNYVEGGTYFFTVVTEKRQPILNTDLARKCLREAFLYCKQEHPFKIDAIIMLPDHIHAIWTLPDGDCDYSKRWGIIKKHFTQSWLKQGGAESSVSKSKQRYRRRGVWQRQSTCGLGRCSERGERFGKLDQCDGRVFNIDRFCCGFNAAE